MTTTKIFQGMDGEGRSSSRVLAPPGGGSSNIFGTSDPAPVAAKPEVASPKPAVQPAPQAQADRVVGRAPKQAFNPITGEPYGAPPKQVQEKDKKEEEKAEEKENEHKAAENLKPIETAKPADAAIKTSTRIAQPPGGKSSGLW